MSKLVRFPCRSQPRLQLVCFPHAGAGASTFREWADAWDDIEVSAVQWPGREDRLSTPPLMNLSTAVEATAAEIAAEASLPLALYGHSLGALAAFETARWLRRHTPVQVRCLIVSSMRAPHLPDRHGPLYELDDDALLEALANRYGGLPDAICQHPELRKIVLVALRGDITMHDTYRYADESPLGCPLIVLGGEDDYVRPDELHAWNVHTSERFSCSLFPHGHFFIQSQRREVLDLITADLTCVPSNTTTGRESAGSQSSSLCYKTTAASVSQSLS